MRRAHVFVVSSLIAGCVVTGTVAAMKTVHLGVAGPKPATVPSSVLAAQQAKLSRWSVSLRRALKAKPPALPHVPHFDPVVIPAVPRVLASAPVHAVRPVVVHRTVATPRAKQPASAPAPTVVAQAAPVVTTVEAPATAARSGGDDDRGDDGRGDGGHGDGGDDGGGGD